MRQHFLLSAEARTLSVREVFELSDEEAFDRFRELRWGTGEEVVCPSCAVVERHWFLPSRRHWFARMLSINIRMKILSS